MHVYSIHVIAEYNLSGSEIICRQIISYCNYCGQVMTNSKVQENGTILLNRKHIGAIFFQKTVSKKSATKINLHYVYGPVRQ